MLSLPRKQDHRKEQASNHRQKHWRNLITKVSFHLTLGAMLLALSGSAAAQQAKKIPRIGYLTGARLTAIANRPRRSAGVCASLGTSREKTLLLNGGLLRETSIAFLRLPPT
jgi:hypothetical protein